MANYRDEEEKDNTFLPCNSRCSSCGYKVGGSCLLTQADVYTGMRADEIAANSRPVPLHCPNHFQTPSTFREKPLQTVTEEAQGKRTKTGKNKNKANPPNVHFI